MPLCIRLYSLSVIKNVKFWVDSIIFLYKGVLSCQNPQAMFWKHTRFAKPLLWCIIIILFAWMSRSVLWVTLCCKIGRSACSKVGANPLWRKTKRILSFVIVFLFVSFRFVCLFVCLFLVVCLFCLFVCFFEESQSVMGLHYFL